MMNESLSMITNLGLVLFTMTTLMAMRLSAKARLNEPGAKPGYGNQ